MNKITPNVQENESTTSRKILNFLHINTIQNKLVAIVFVALTILGIIGSTVIYQNAKTKEVLDFISVLRIPVPIVTSDIMEGANRAAASQRAYLMTGEIKYKEERLSVWNEQIKPAAAELKNLQRYMQVAEHIATVDAAIAQIEVYENVQTEIDTFFETELKSLNESIYSSDSLSADGLVYKLKRQKELDRELDSLVAGKASKARKNLREIVTPLKEAQRKLLIQDNASANSRVETTNVIILIVSVFGITLIIAFSILLIRRLTKSIRKPTEVLTKMSQGHLPEIDSHSNDELNDIFHAANLLSSNMKKASEFALAIGSGKFDHDFKPSSADDKLGNSLIHMRDRLNEVAKQDNERKWVSEGLAQFSDVLRSDLSNIEAFSKLVVSQVVKYTNANQGALFIVEGEGTEEYLELKGCYAWERIKHLSKRIQKGDGLVGQVWIERSSMYLEEVPKNFVQITSGLGAANPTSLYITPVMNDDQIVGILELAFFHRLEDHHKEFIEKLSSNLAATISTAKINIHTKALLEQSQQQGEEMKAQEEEIRQNMEELAATQEEMQRKSVEMENRINAINESGMATIEFTPAGNILSANESFLNLMGYSLNEIVNRHHRMFVEPSYSVTLEYKKFWDDLANGISKPGEYMRITKAGTKVYIKGSYLIINDLSGKVLKILKLVIDITAIKERALRAEAV